MKYQQEEFANELYLALIREFDSSTTTISIDGAGVSWHCTVERGNSRCRISCFSPGPEYYCSYIRNSSETATSRMSSRDDTIVAVGDWLEGRELAVLYDRYPFIDRKKRALTKIREDAIEHSQELKTEAESELEHQFGDFYYLHFHANDRSCKLSFYGKNERPDAKFSWDECQLFQFQPTDNRRFATVLKRWICDSAMPSELRTEFPWLNIGELADYYERGNPIEGEFIRSWDRMEEFYKPDRWRFSTAVLSMIKELREAGYDRQLRAGQSLSSLGLSRSRRHGLTNRQACIWFQFRNSTMTVSAEFAQLTLEEHPIQFTHKLRALLDSLVQFDIE
ncbi:MAG: hypothetical protein P1V97_11840 [Planctomycetota bacterium]|nr:hypothetical protein [Planctomycetota bacterium]